MFIIINEISKKDFKIKKHQIKHKASINTEDEKSPDPQIDDKISSINLKKQQIITHYKTKQLEFYLIEIYKLNKNNLRSISFVANQYKGRLILSDNLKRTLSEDILKNCVSVTEFKKFLTKNTFSHLISELCDYSESKFGSSKMVKIAMIDSEGYNCDYIWKIIEKNILLKVCTAKSNLYKNVLHDISLELGASFLICDNLSNLTDCDMVICFDNINFPEKIIKNMSYVFRQQSSTCNLNNNHYNIINDCFDENIHIFDEFIPTNIEKSEFLAAVFNFCLATNIKKDLSKIFQSICANTLKTGSGIFPLNDLTLILKSRLK